MSPLLPQDSENFIRIWISDKFFVIEPIGEIDSANVDLLGEAFWLHTLFDQHNVYFCADRLEFISSAGLGTVLGNLKDIRDRGNTLTIGGLNERNRDLFMMLGLEKVINFVDGCEYGTPAMAGLIAAGRVQQLAPIRRFTEKFLSERYVPENEIGRIVLMVDELCSNLARHNIPTAPAPDNIVVTIQVVEKQIMVRIMDRGRQFDPTSYQAKSIDELIESRYKGGLGLRMVKMLADELTYFRLGDRNVVQLVRHINM